MQERIEELIKKAVAEQEKKPGTNAVSPLKVIANDMEKQYLAGELTARQFMLIMQELQLYSTNTIDAAALSVLPQQLRARYSTNAPAGTNTISAAEDAAFTDIEKKIDDLMARRAETQKSTATNAPAAVVEPKTKRERLDQLLNLYVNDKITREEYETRRAKILAEPDGPGKK